MADPATAAWDGSRPLWEVVGGVQSGGILVREGAHGASPEKSRRLSHGAWLQEERLEGHRLCYRLLAGEGPETGWVSLKCKDHDLVVQRSEPPPRLQEERNRAALVHSNWFQSPELLLPTFSFFPLPWDAMRLAPVCRAWHSFLSNSSECWASIRLQSQVELRALPALLGSAGPRLRSLNLSKVTKGTVLVDLGPSLRSCPHLEILNVAGCEGLSFAKMPDVMASLSKSLRKLNVKGCSALHPMLPPLLGSKLQVLEAGWLSENNPHRNFAAWTSVFPRQLFKLISIRSPGLKVLRIPGFALYHGQPESELGPVLREYAEISTVSSLRHLKRLDLSCAQLLEDTAVVKIAGACKHLRSINIRCCESVTDRGLSTIASHLGKNLTHINLSCCQFSEAAVRRLIASSPRLKTLDLCYCRGLGHGLITFLCEDPALCPDLRMIGAGGLDIGDKEVEEMCRKYSRTLDHLGIGSAARLTDVGLRCLAGLPRLQRVSAHQLQNVSAAGLVAFCRDAPALRELDADQCEYTPAPGTEDLEALEQCFRELPYDYDQPDEESDDEETEHERRERERLRKDNERREKLRRDRLEKERREREEKAGAAYEVEPLFAAIVDAMDSVACQGGAPATSSS